jgi:1-hydroxycarotenoid 3,4-desaturase
MPEAQTIVIGAGVGGLACAIDLAAQGIAVHVLERASAPGGKMRVLRAGGFDVDAGPTVFTLRSVFEDLFASAGVRLTDRLTLNPLDVLARHAWAGGAQLDLYADRARSADAIGRFAGHAAARGYLSFCARAKRVHDVLERDFMRAPRPSPRGLVRAIGWRGALTLLRNSPFRSLWSALREDFPDPRLRQLFARYATYVGSSPFACPATLMLIAHVEQEGVWSVEGGMGALARALAELAQARGASIQTGADVVRIELRDGAACGVTLADGTFLSADAVVCNADAAALAAGCFGREIAARTRSLASPHRSLSAHTWALRGNVQGFGLLRHNVFFSRDYRAEFDAIFSQGRAPDEPTVYVCAQDRDDAPRPDGNGPERLLVLANAPANGDTQPTDRATTARVGRAVQEVLKRCGAEIELDHPTATATGPAEFGRLFPATGGALYGRASHGAMASFKRPGTATPIPGLYLAGGSAHPGAGVPMTALSGRLAATAVRKRLDSIARSRATAMPGGMRTAGATTAGSGSS